MLLATGCTDSDTPVEPGDVEATSDADAGGFAAAHFASGHGLVPRYIAVEETVADLIGYLEESPEDGLRTFVPEGAWVSGDGNRIELSAGFWAQPPGEAYAAAAQIVHSLAASGISDEVTLLDGGDPGNLQDGSFEPIPQPLSAASFDELQPWFTVVQPEPGRTVSDTLEIEIEAQGPAQMSALVLLQGEILIGGQRSFDGRTTIALEGGQTGAADLFIKVGLDGGPYDVVLPLIVEN